MNCDGAVNGLDVDGFVLALTDLSSYASRYPNCNVTAADVNGDGFIDVQDIGAFVIELTEH